MLKNRMIGKPYEVTKGIVDACLVHPRECFSELLRRGASAVVFVHNHPTGDPTPSIVDLQITKQLIAAGKIIDIKPLDHVIIGNTVVSLREDGLCVF